MKLVTAYLFILRGMSSLKMRIHCLKSEIALKAADPYLIRTFNKFGT